jgi:serine phosphatase RsbU (regulator of sigma subunit)
LINYKNTNYSIDGNDIEERQYSEQKIALQKGDSIYLFTDGYVDQFGERINRRLGSRRFQEIVVSLQDKSTKEQEQIIQDQFDDWRGHEKQIDDVLVVGVQF